MKPFFLYLLFCMSVFSLSAKELYFQHIRLDDGSVQPSAISVYQDAKGYIWFGNDNLNVYDGNRIRSFRLSAYMEGVEDTNIHSICGDGDSCIYLLADKRLITYNMRTEEFRNTGVVVNALIYCNKSVFYALANVLYRYSPDGKSEKVCVLPDSASVIKAILWSEGGWLLGTTNGLFRYSGTTCTTLLENESVSSLFLDDQKRLWAGTVSNGAKVFEAGRWLTFREGDSVHPLINNQVRCINQDLKGNIWIGTFTGITIIESSFRECFHLSHKEHISWSLCHSSVYAIFRDIQGGMWVGTYYGGLSYFNPDTENYTFYGVSPDEPNSLSGFLFGNMTEDTKGNLYIATEHGGLNCLDRRTGSVNRLDTGIAGQPCHTTKSVWYDAVHECLYIGTFQHGLLRYSSPGHFEQIGELGDQLQIVTNLIPWKDHLIVVTQEGVQLLDLSTRQLSPLFPNSELRSRTGQIIRAAYLDSRDRLWLALAEKELICVRMDTRRTEEIPFLMERIGRRPVQSITGDEQGNLYFAVSGIGILRYETTNNHWTTYSQEQGHLLTNQPFRIGMTPLGMLLVTSARGITLIDMKSGESFHTLVGASSPLHRINANCGIYISPSDSIIFVGGVEGMIAARETALFTSRCPYTIKFNSLSVNNKPVHPASDPDIVKEAIPYVTGLILPHDQNNITIGFTSTNYRHVDKNLFEYKLEGWDQQWTRTRHYQVVYTSLRPGKYRLLVREVGGTDQIEMPIRILPPYYATVYAYGLYILLIILFLVWLIRFNRIQAVLKASLELEHLEKLKIEGLNQMKLKFYINISHELRTPLTLMTSQIDLMLKSYGMEGVLKGKLLKVRRYTEQMQQLITEVLDFRRLEQGQMPLQVSRQNLVPFIRQVFDMFRDYALANRIGYKLEIADEDIPVWFDPVQIRKVLNNLLSNAFKFTPENGCVRVALIRKRDVSEIRISDTGSGIALNQQAHIFERFYQADNAVGVSLSGNGIGLALTREIILQHKGTIEVQSELGKGTTFIVRLQLGEQHFTDQQKSAEASLLDLIPDQSWNQEKDEIAVTVPEEMSAEVGDKSVSVLIVEDNEELLQILEEAFSIQYKVYKAAEGEEGIRRAEEMQPDLIISDVMMPGLSGTMMCQRLKRKLETSHIPIILLTARTDLESTLEGMKCGACDYVVKPFNMELLLLKCNNIISTLHHQQAYFRMEVGATPSGLATNRLDRQLLDTSVRIIEENMESKEFNIDMWCREVAIGRTRLGEKIKSITGLTLNDFILQIKLRKCASLLRQTDLTISEIAWKVGFSSPGYLGKCFKENFGVTPLQYKNVKK